MTRLSLLAAVILPVCSSLYAQTPASELRAAVTDLASLPTETRPGCRYLSLYAVAPEKRAKVAQVVSYTLNALSRVRTISAPKAVTPTLLRFSIATYAPSAGEFAKWSAAWEQLGQVEPYWHIRTQISGLGVRDLGLVKTEATQKVLRPSSESRAPNPEPRIVTVDGGWVGLDSAAYLRGMSGSNAALVRADWFVAQATTAQNYYAFAGIPAKEDEFLKALGVDAPLIDKLRANSGANLFISNITRKPRRIIWSQGPLGGVYETLDQAEVTAEKDPIRRAVSVGAFALKYDAGEWFAVAPNGLFRVAVYDSAGRRADSVLDKIAKDSSDDLSDGIVQPMVSCIRCHTESGLRPFRDDQTALFASGHIDLTSYDAGVVQRAAEFYDEPRLQRQMAFDRETYALAVKRACGMTPEALAAALAETVRDFAYLPVTTEQAARELGVHPADFVGKAAASYDPITLNLIERRPCLRGQWESSFAEAAVLVTSGK